MLITIFSAVRKAFEYVGLVSKPHWELTEEEEELARRLDELFQKETVVYQERLGHVTQTTGNAIELNHRWIYQLVHDDDVFSVGDYVSWKEYKTEAGIVIKDVVKASEKGKYELTTIENVKIVKVDDTKYETSTGAIFCINKVRCDAQFRPKLSDFVKIEVCYPKNDTEEFDPDPDSVLVKRVAPNDTRLVTGKVTSWDASTFTGVVNKEVIFHQNVCDQLTPTIGTSVVCDCVKGDYGEYSWRAYNMTKNMQKRSTNQKHFFNVEQVPFFDVVLGESKTIDLRVSNCSDFPILIEDVQLLTNGKKETPSKMALPYSVLPQTTISWPVDVKGHKLGRQNMKISWFIAKKNFPINTTIYYNTISSMEQKSLEAQPQRGRLRNDRSLRIPGPRMIRDPIFRKVHMKEYAIPEKLRELVPHNVGLDVTEIQIALQRERPALGDGLNEQNYGEYMHTLLYLEEIAENEEYEKMSTRASLYKTKDCVVFNFPADSEFNKIVVGDTVLAAKPWENIKYDSRVLATSSVQLCLKFNADFEQSMTSGALYDLEFRHNRSTDRRRHQAVDLVLQNLKAEWLFPNESDITENFTETSIEKWYNNDLNHEQKNAVKSILAKKNLPYPYIIYGPPGTGKTVTVVETILQIVSHQKDARILVTAPTNSAVDTLGVRLLEFDVFARSEMVRLSSYNAWCCGIIDVQLVDISMVPSLGDPAHDAPLLRDVEKPPTLYVDEIGNHKVTIGTLSTISYLNSAGVRKGFFTHVIIDEAGQCHEPDTLLPIALVEYNKTQLVLAGDPQQLGPVTNSLLAKQYSYDRSFLDRLTKCYMYRKKADDFRDTHGYNPKLITRLVNNYRSLPKIVNLIGSIFYGGDLWPTISDNNSREAELLRRITIHREVLGKNMESMIFINIDTPEEQIDGSLSWYNQGEVAQVFFVLNFLYSAKVSPDDIGVITPYILQVKKISEYLDVVGAFSPKIASVEEFQGQERDIIILSLVRNNFGVHKRLSSFLTDPHRVNVALSRARVLNIIIGNRTTLVADPLWAEIICKCVVINLTATPSIEDTVD